MPARETKRYLNKIADGQDLSESEIQDVLDLLMSGVANPVQMGAFLMGLRV